ncbi:MAG: hypothetical protein DRN83_01690 [Hadesarchaea archaeon]|nr:MAG: hypothetical protein DRN83_01690 [Hadesarchaea archaeon]
MRRLVLLGAAILVILVFPSNVSGTPGNFILQGDEMYDNWGLCRSRAWGEDGFFQIADDTFRPAIAFESLGELKDVAWEVGQRLARQYPDRNQLAEKIFAYGRDHVRYTSDLDQFGMEEFARNADETAWEIESLGFSRGDCEDYAVLLAVMYRAAGFRSAVVLAPGHAATLVHLPDYPRANVYWNFEDTGGWIWAEGTGRTNPLGWTPPEFMDSDLVAYEITEEENIFGIGRSGMIMSSGGGGPPIGFSSFFSVIFFLWLISAFGRR